MDPSSAVRTDTLPAIATLVVPGAWASSGYLLAIVGRADDRVAIFFNTHETTSAILGVLLFTLVGFAIESVGSYVEVYVIDRRRPNHPSMLEYWWKYLTLIWTNEPVGQHHIRRILVSFKFELNMFVASVAALPSVLILALSDLISWGRAGWIAAGLLCAACAFFYFAKSSSPVLADVRRHLVDRYWTPVP